MKLTMPVDEKKPNESLANISEDLKIDFPKEKNILRKEKEKFSINLSDCRALYQVKKFVDIIIRKLRRMR
jgi:hypothetical protein